MTGKDLLEGLNFVDDNLIEEAGKETLSAETTEEKPSAQLAEEKKRSAETTEEKPSAQLAEKKRRSAELVEEKKRSAESVETKMQSKSGKHSGKHSGKVVFLRATVSVAAGLLIFAAGTAVGSHKTVKPLRGGYDGQTAYTLTEEDPKDQNEHAPAKGAQPEDQTAESQPEGVAVLGVYQGEEEQSTSYNGEAPVQEGMVGAQVENSDIDTLSLSEDVKVGRKIESSQTQQVQGGHLPQMPATVVGGISVYFYQQDDAENSTENSFFADFEQNNVSYTLQADTLREVVQAAADAICGTGVVTVVN